MEDSSWNDITPETEEAAVAVATLGALDGPLAGMSG
jgi:hypothetical protein